MRAIYATTSSRLYLPFEIKSGKIRYPLLIISGPSNLCTFMYFVIQLIDVVVSTKKRKKLCEIVCPRPHLPRGNSSLIFPSSNSRVSELYADFLIRGRTVRLTSPPLNHQTGLTVCTLHALRGTEASVPLLSQLQHQPQPSIRSRCRFSQVIDQNWKLIRLQSNNVSLRNLRCSCEQLWISLLESSTPLV